jgi:hypothetical protein
MRSRWMTNRFLRPLRLDYANIVGVKLDFPGFSGQLGDVVQPLQIPRD